MKRILRAGALVAIPAMASHDEFIAHMRAQHGDGSPRRATALPASAAAPVLRFDPTLFAARGGGAADDSAAAGAAVYDAMLAHEAALRVAAPHTEFPYVLCGPQPHAADARAAIAAVTGMASIPVRVTLTHVECITLGDR
jgi:hypothetical protein